MLKQLEVKALQLACPLPASSSTQRLPVSTAGMAIMSARAAAASSRAAVHTAHLRCEWDQLTSALAETAEALARAQRTDSIFHAVEAVASRTEAIRLLITPAMVSANESEIILHPSENSTIGEVLKPGQLTSPSRRLCLSDRTNVSKINNMDEVQTVLTENKVNKLLAVSFMIIFVFRLDHF
ncbi:unnamed protein product [Protopolystoma xenopodis]|uniref:Uncharacterized protein n=1 Tax=Protopolystoma xenopodis TaxID=117903 RepID=A0A448X0B5_9PLAT|nr:unnamed protein product [Protopolystoma xenopodis]